ncbi:MAG: hypothetical protein J7K90_04950 [Desulfuromusa sp.]|nr:hypothetical protein [Desulfuromusa sp.]
MKQLTNVDYKQIILRRDPRYDGRLYFGVTTTKIYCRPVCPARRLSDYAGRSENLGQTARFVAGSWIVRQSPRPKPEILLFIKAPAKLEKRVAEHVSGVDQKPCPNGNKNENLLSEDSFPYRSTLSCC